jgi:hypothetical protein
MANISKQIQDSLHRLADQLRSNVKPKTTHGQQSVRDTEAKIKQKIEHL